VAFAAPAFDNRGMGRFERRWRAASRRHWAILVACLVVVFAGVLLAVGERATPGVVVLAPPPLAKPTTYSVAETATVERAAPDPSIGPKGSERVDVCGLGWVDPALLDRMPALVGARARLLESLASSDDGFERAASLWLKTIDPASTTLAADFHEQLARSASTTHDPRVYALAFKSCAKTSDAPSCALLSARRWAQLDADNGEPWLFLFDEATTRRDRQQAEDALFHLGAAPRFDDRQFAVAGLLAARPAGPDVLLLAATQLATDAIGLASAEVLPLQTVVIACRGLSLVDLNRRQRCDAVAAALADRSDTLLVASVGSTLGRGLGWPQARLDAIGALSSARAESLPPDAGSSFGSCRRLAAWLDRLAHQSVVGEARLAREWIESRGMSVEGYAARQAELRRSASEMLARASDSPLAVGASADGGAPASAASR
jgi:hypothetical protein